MANEVATARELATHAADIKHLQDDMDKLMQDIGDVKLTLASIQVTLSEAKGGWKAMMLLGGASSVIGAGVAHVASWWSK